MLIYKEISYILCLSESSFLQVCCLTLVTEVPSSFPQQVWLRK